MPSGGREAVFKPVPETNAAPSSLQAERGAGEAQQAFRISAGGDMNGGKVLAEVSAQHGGVFWGEGSEAAAPGGDGGTGQEPRARFLSQRPPSGPNGFPFGEDELKSGPAHVNRVVGAGFLEAGQSRESGMVSLAEVSLDKDAGQNDELEYEVPTVVSVLDEAAILAAEGSGIGPGKVEPAVAPKVLGEFAIVLERTRVKS